MTEEARPIRCHAMRATREPCMEPATVEIVGPAPTLYCEEHARYRLEENLDERWEQSSPEEYARACEDAVSQLYRWEHETNNTILAHEVLAEARWYLQLYELPRARKALRAAGGKPQATDEELDMLRFFRKCAEEHGWTDAPPWVPKVEKMAAERERSESR